MNTSFASRSSRFSRSGRACLFAAALALLGCSKRAEPHASPASEAAQATASAASNTDETQRGGMRTLAGQLAFEAQERTPGLRVEDAFAALASAGLGIAQPRQYLAKVAGADYCAGGATDSGIAISACEYASAEQARRSVALVEKRFPGFTAGRRVLYAGRLSIALSAGNTAPAPEVLARAEAALTGERFAAR